MRAGEGVGIDEGGGPGGLGGLGGLGGVGRLGGLGGQGGVGARLGLAVARDGLRLREPHDREGGVAEDRGGHLLGARAGAGAGAGA